MKRNWMKMLIQEMCFFSPSRTKRKASSFPSKDRSWMVLHWLTVIVELSADACNDPHELLSRERAYIRGTRRQHATVKVKS